MARLDKVPRMERHYASDRDAMAAALRIVLGLRRTPECRRGSP